jgi:membrane-associated phospholipid phosphatase
MFSFLHLKQPNTNYFFWLYYLFIVVFGGLQLIYSPAELFLSVNKFVENNLTEVFKIVTFLGSGWMFAGLCLILLLLDKWKGIIASTSFAITSLVAQSVKNLLPNFARPFEYFAQQKIAINFPLGAEELHWFSFPSGHTISAFSIFCLLSLLIKNKYASIFFALLAFLVALSRVYLVAHFVRDTYFGMLIGVELTCIVHYWFTTKLQKQF